MNKSITNVLASAVIIITLSIFAGSDPGVEFETKYGLPTLYKLRNTYSSPAPPSNVFIITPYKTRSDEQPDALRDWDRTKYANIINKLSKLGVAVIAIDMHFRDQHPHEDEEFAHAISQAGNVILNQIARRNDQSKDILKNSIEPLASSTQVMAPPQVISDQARIDAFYSFYQFTFNENDHNCFGYPSDADQNMKGLETHIGENRIATLPVAALEQYLYSIGKLQKYINLSGVIKLNEQNQKYCEFIVKVRKKIANDSQLLDVLKKDSSGNKPLSSWFMLLNQLSQHNLKPNENPSFNLNLYGPPQTLHTLDFEEFLDAHLLITTDNTLNPFKDSVVFIGGSFNEPADQKKDAFNTVFTKSELHISGVEISATGFSNLYNNNYLVRHDKKDAFFAILFVCFSIVLLSFISANKKFVLLSICVALVYALISVYQFTSNYFWPPFIIPILAITFITLYELFDRFYLTSKDKIKLEKNIKLYLSNTVANQVAKDKAYEMENTICLVTDVVGFTSISERLAPEKLHTLNRDYFELLFDCVTDYGADVIKTYGDSLTAVWKIKHQASYQQAIQAGLKILSQVNKFNIENQATPFHTRIGMSSGQIVIGYVGGDSYRTVELTGDAIYIASRLEQLNKQTNTKFLATQEFASLTQGIESKYIGKQNLRGKSKPTEIIEIISINSYLLL